MSGGAEDADVDADADVEDANDEANLASLVYRVKAFVLVKAYRNWLARQLLSDPNAPVATQTDTGAAEDQQQSARAKKRRQRRQKGQSGSKSPELAAATSGPAKPTEHAVHAEKPLEEKKEDEVKEVPAGDDHVGDDSGHGGFFDFEELERSEAARGGPEIDVVVPDEEAKMNVRLLSGMIGRTKQTLGFYEQLARLREAELLADLKAGSDGGAASAPAQDNRFAGPAPGVAADPPVAAQPQVAAAADDHPQVGAEENDQDDSSEGPAPLLSSDSSEDMPLRTGVIRRNASESSESDSDSDSSAGFVERTWLRGLDRRLTHMAALSAERRRIVKEKLRMRKSARRRLAAFVHHMHTSSRVTQRECEEEMYLYRVLIKKAGGDLEGRKPSKSEKKHLNEYLQIVSLTHRHLMHRVNSLRQGFGD